MATFTPPPAGLVANQYAHWNPDDPLARRDARFMVESGSLFSTGTEWSTGSPVDNTDPAGRDGVPNHSAIFRCRTTQLFRDNVVELDLKFVAWTAFYDGGLAGWDPDWDQCVMWQRCQPPERTEGRIGQSLYAAYVGRRDGVVMIKKKVADGGSSNGGTYYPLTPEVRNARPVVLGAWQHVEFGAVNVSPTAVELTLRIDGVTVAHAIDDGTVGSSPAITADGQIGVRGDNAELRWKGWVVRPPA